MKTLTYQTIITRKGQITVPKEIRDYLGLKRSQKVFIEFEKGKRTARIRPAVNFLEAARKIKIRKKLDPLLARDQMEKAYVRI